MAFCNYVFIHNTLYKIHDTSNGGVAVWAGCEQVRAFGGSQK